MSLTASFLLDPYPFEVWVAVRTDRIKGSGTLNDPYGIDPDSPAAAAQFDSLMNSLPAYARIHLGPGVFKTQGYVVGALSGWPKPGMRITGSGVDATTLQVANPEASDTMLFALGHPLNLGTQPNLLDYFELSDLTIDCNLANGTGANVSCGGVRVMGNHLRLHRVKVINWGTKTTAKPCLALAVVAADPSVLVPSTIDPGIVDCIVVQPSAANVGPATAIHIGRKDDAVAVVEGFAQGAFIRHCFVDCGWPTATAESRGLSMEWCRGGTVEANQVHFTQYGGPYAEKASIREMVVRDNFYKNVTKGPYWKLGKLNPSSPQSITSLGRDGSDPSVAVATATAHGLQPGDRVKMDASAGSPSLFKGIFLVKDVTSPDVFRYQMTSAASSDATSPTMQKVFGVNNLLVEGNTVELAHGAGGVIAIHLDDDELPAATPDCVHGDIIVRGNHIHYVDGQFDPSWSGYGIQMNGAKNLIVRDNIVECAPANPIRNQRCGAVKYFNNQTPSGTLIRGVEFSSGRKYDELETEAEDAFVLAFLEKR